jgi:para-aminobenzoate synthetase component 1
MPADNPRAFLDSPTPIPLVRTLPWPDEPGLLFQAFSHSPYSFLLESMRPHPAIGRYSIMGDDPFLVVQSKGTRNILQDASGRSEQSGDPIELARRLFQRYGWPRPSGLPPFFGGMIGLFSYDLVRFFERIPRHAVDDLRWPDLVLLFVDTAAVFDALDRKVWLIYGPPRERFDQENRERLLKEGLERLDRLESRLKMSAMRAPMSHEGHRQSSLQSKREGEAPPALPASEDRALPVRARGVGASEDLPQADRTGPHIGSSATRAPIMESNFDRSSYTRMIRRCQEYILSGDIYQANLSQRFAAGFDRDPYRLYLSLRKINPSPFGAYLNLGDRQVVSGSPERLLKSEGGMLQTRPIAGTRPRGRDPNEDERLRNDLLKNEKERAEHLMLVDLERNDLGRVCRYGTVKLSEFMATEQYSHVIHIVSNIMGEPAPGTDPFSILRAVFPGGTITGVPKVRCMEIIDELEPAARGPYTGSVGYISWGGEMDLNILIRTGLVNDGRVYVQAGGGIVADSDPDREYDETLHKAQAFFEALRSA